ncbi:MAG: type III polyketide synthase [Balneolaceae bacterium]
MPAYIRTIETLPPPYRYNQDLIREQMKEQVAEDEVQKRLIHAIYSRSGIKHRHSVLPDFQDAGVCLLYEGTDFSAPGTSARNRVYEEEARKLYTGLARKLLEKSNGLKPESVTHLITISCTGFYAPGPDYDVIRALGLSPRTERYHLCFMGCYASLPGLKLASRICETEPDAVVLVLSVELCTLHFQGGLTTDDLISASVFADGAAGAIVTGHQPDENRHFRIRGFESVILSEGADQMAWTIGDHGFNMVLSSYIPDILARNLNPFLDQALDHLHINRDQIDRWALHPGGRAIIDRAEKSLCLPAEALAPSRTVLSEYGNMSSATLLFVLKEMLEHTEPEQEEETVMAMAFGPGITFESGLFSLIRTLEESRGAGEKHGSSTARDRGRALNRRKPDAQRA